MPKYLIIANPTANRGATGLIIPEIRETLKSHGLEFDLVETGFPWHAAKMAEDAVTAGYDGVVAAGGDGTANEVLNGLMLARLTAPHPVLMGVIPVGRGNDFAYSMGIPTTLAEGVATLAAGKHKAIDVGWVKGGLYPEGRYFGNGIGIGFDAVVGFVAARNKILRGFMSYLWAAIKTITLYYNAPEMKIELDSETLTQPVIMLSIMNGIRMGGSFMMVPGNLVDDGLLTLGIYNQMSRAKMLAMLPRVMAGTQFSDPVVQKKQSHIVKVTALKGTLPVHGDGETICTEGHELEIELFPRQIELITHIEENAG